MVKHPYRSIWIMLIFVVSSFLANGQTNYPVTSSWVFKQGSKKDWLKATVPGTVHTDLLANKLIDDPYYRTNEEKLQWIEREDWEYQTTITPEPSLLSQAHIELVFDGLDTYATVYLNGKEIIKADNMFRTWRADVKKLLKPGKNELRIFFPSVVNQLTPAYDSLKFKLPYRDNNVKMKYINNYVRKASYQFGWDWGPRFVTSGIWRPVYFQGWDEVKISDLFIKQKKLSREKAELQAQIEVFSAIDGLRTVELSDGKSNAIFKQTAVLLRKGENLVNVSFEINQPKLLWSNGLGTQTQYTFVAKLKNANKTLAVKQVKRGLRTIEVVEESGAKGRSFYIKLNGTPVFMKGSNYIPSDSFIPRMTKERYVALISAAQQSHMNMLRVWGGGIYENQEFYDLCDEKGILVWQDFMFASGMYPDDQGLKRNIYLEAGENVKRLRNHTSIALWCGDNEAAMLWGRWITPAFKKRFWDNPADSAKIINTYAEIMHSILPSAIKRYDEEKFYWSSSPQSNNYAITDENTMQSGDIHYWGVWWDKKPFNSYNEVIAPFASEYGFQSFPSMETISTFAVMEDYDITSEVMKLHQKSSIGNSTITEYMKLYYNVPERFDDFIYVGQLLQADGIKTAIEAHRRNKPFTMGSLYWQLNDSWPVASWSGIDYYGRWKALQYQVKRSFEETILSIVEEKGKLHLYAVTDRQSPIAGKLMFKILDFKGKVLHSSATQINLNANQSLQLKGLDFDQYTTRLDKKNTVLAVSLVAGGKVVSNAQYYFSSPKDLQLAKVTINKTLTKAAGRYELKLSSSQLAKSVKIAVNGQDVIFSDNYIDLLPGEAKTITFSSNIDVNAKDITITCLNDLR